MSTTETTPSQTERLPNFIDGTSAADAAERLHRLYVILIGGGSVGISLAVHAAHCQVCELAIVDPAEWESENMLTSDITPEAIGRAKASWLAQRCRSISARTRVTPYRVAAQQLPGLVWARGHVVLLASDNLPCEQFVSDRCRQFGIPLIQAAVSGESLLAQVRCLSNLHPQGPCLTCSYNPVQWRLHDEQARLSCSGEQIGQRAATRSAAFLCTLAGTLAINQLVRRTLSLGRPVDDELVSFCGYSELAFDIAEASLGPLPLPPPAP